ncbi:MAG: TonB-dependent receptor [Candidatus Aminicenantes bacterium]|nr:MAG: TonB-dependent receptor [Candidatus Aminicenantes bacterium]
MNNFFKQVFIVAACLLLASSLFASETGEIKGRVTDEEGISLPGVTVTAKSPSLQGIRNSITDENGSFLFPLLPIGKYSLTYELSGFEKVTQTGYEVRLGFTVSIEVVLKIATISEEIIVTADNPLLDKKNTDNSYRLNADDLSRAPIQGRTVQEIVGYTPGVTGVRASTIFGTNTGLPSFRGEGEEGNNWLVDGLSAKGVSINDAGVRINYDSWEEVQIISDGFTPDLGQSMGGIINAVTKSGGNKFHGELGALVRDWNLRAKREDQWSVVTEPNTSLHQYFGNLGGPIIKDKIWFFLSDNFHRRLDDTDAETIVWLTFPAGKRRYNTNNAFGKITFTPAQNHTFSLSGTLDKFVSQSGGTGLPATYTKTTYTDYSYRINYRGILSSSSLLEGAWGQYKRDSSIKPLEENYGPARYYWLDITQFTNNAMGDNNDMEKRTDFTVRLTQYADFGNLGNHEISLGFSYYRTYSEESNRWTGQDFDPWKGNGFDNGVEITWIGPGSPTRLTEYGVYGFNNYTKGFGIYLSDTITVGRVALMLGLRTETQGIYDDTGNEIENLDGEPWKWGFRDFLSPRASIAIDLLNDGKNILKFSFGQFPNTISTRVLQFFNTQGGFSWRRYDWIGGTNPTDSQLKDPANWSFVLQQSSETTPFGVDPDVKTNKTTKFLFEFDRYLAPNWILKLRGVYSYARNLTELVGFYDPVYIFVWNFANFKAKKRDYKAIEVELNGRITDKFTLSASYTWSQAKGTNPGQFEYGFWAGTAGNAYEAGVFGDHMKLPDDHPWKALIDWFLEGMGGEGFDEENESWYGFLPYSVDHQVKILGTYIAPYGFFVSAGIEYLSGYHWEKKGYSAGYGDYYLFPEGRGVRTTPDHVYVDLSVEKDFTLPRGFVVGLRINIFNLLNSQTPISYVKADTALFGEVWGRQMPRWLQLQVIFRF